MSDLGADLDLGVNEGYRDAILEASKRTGMEPHAIAAVIDAEAAKGPNGVWNPKSKAKTSSARGLTQFLDGTWKTMAKDKTTALHEAAQGKNWSQVSAMRDDPNMSIMTAAEYDSNLLSDLQKKGLVDEKLTPTEKAQAAYMAHHEGPGGASTLLRYRKGQLSPKELKRFQAKSKKNLAIQVGGKAKAQKLIDEAGGDAAKAYSDWFGGYVNKKIQPDKYRAKPKDPPEQKGTAPSGDSSSSDSGGGPRIKDGEPTVLLGTDKRMAAHVKVPHEGGGKMVEGSQTVFLGKDQNPFARKGDMASDQLVIKGNTQTDVRVG